MEPRPGSSAPGYRFWLMAAVVALLAGAAASKAFVPLVAGLALCVLVWAVASHPRESVIALALASPFYDLAVIQIAGIADIRILEILWLIAAISLALRIHSGAEKRFDSPPRWFTFALLALTGWFLLAALVSGGGIRPIIEAIQTVYLCGIAYLVAGVISATDAAELARWLRPWTLVLGAVFVLSLAGYVLGFQPIAQTVVKVPQMSVEYLAVSPLVQGAGSDFVQIARLSVLNLGPVGTAAMLVSILVVAFAFVLVEAEPARRHGAYLLLASGVCVLLLTYSRAGWVLAIAAAGVVILGISLRRATIALAILTIVLALVASLPGVASRVEDFTDTSEGSYQAHARLWVTALYMIEERPVFGWGPGMYAEKADALAINSWMATDISADQPHNWLLEIAAETGLVGGAIAVIFIGILLAMGWRQTRGAPLPAFGVWVATGCYVAMNLTLNAFRTEMMWVWFGALVGVGAWYAKTAAVIEDAECES